MSTLETLEAFRDRIGYQYKDMDYDLDIPQSQKEKVDPETRALRAYLGDTVIFDLPQDTKAAMAAIQSELYALCGECFAERLPEDSFHITLHDLTSGPCEKRGEVIQTVLAHKAQVNAILDSFRRDHPCGQIIRVRPTRVFNMVSKSVVLGFEPESEEDCAALMGMYDALQAVVPLNALTPHVTLAYYHPARESEEASGRLRNALRTVNGKLRREPVALSLDELYYAFFADMKSYSRDIAALYRTFSKSY